MGGSGDHGSRVCLPPPLLAHPAGTSMRLRLPPLVWPSLSAPERGRARIQSLKADAMPFIRRPAPRVGDDEEIPLARELPQTAIDDLCNFFRQERKSTRYLVLLFLPPPMTGTYAIRTTGL